MHFARHSKTIQLGGDCARCGGKHCEFCAVRFVNYLYLALTRTAWNDARSAIEHSSYLHRTRAAVCVCAWQSLSACAASASVIWVPTLFLVTCTIDACTISTVRIIVIVQWTSLITCHFISNYPFVWVYTAHHCNNHKVLIMYDSQYSNSKHSVT